MADPTPPGFYGKLPAAGDFLSRRVPAPWLAIWDPFLRQLVADARTRAGTAWPQAWLTAPLWHFGLGAGVLAPDQIWGVLIPSADRVGRLFPFTILAQAMPHGVPLETWALAAEAAAVDSLSDDFEADALLQRLAELGSPRHLSVGTTVPTQPLPDPPGAWPDRVATAGGPAPGHSLWWCRGAGPVSPVLLHVPQLPFEQCAAMLVGGSQPN
jgi:type VI secretion system protein ImpM